MNPGFRSLVLAPARAMVVLALAMLRVGPAAAQPLPEDGSPPPAPSTPPPASRPAAPASWLRQQVVAPLPGGLDTSLLINDNNPELVRAPGILISSFDPARGWNGQPLGVSSAHLNRPLNGSFGLFSHHVVAGDKSPVGTQLWLAVVAAPRSSAAVRLDLVRGFTALSQAPTGGSNQPDAPFLPLPPLLEQGMLPIWAGPGGRVATELLDRGRSPLLPGSWTLPPGQLTALMVLPLPVTGMDPPLNGRNLQLRLASDGPVDVATLAAFVPGDQPPDPAAWAQLLQGDLSPREHPPSPRGSNGPMIYSRVSGIQKGQIWQGRLAAPGLSDLPFSQAPISWPLASLERGTLGSDQVQTASLERAYPGTAWAAHGNYGVEYDLRLPLRNDTTARRSLQLALESPLKGDKPVGGLRFYRQPGKAVTFRGTVEVTGLDGPQGDAEGRRRFHVVLRSGEVGPALGSISLAPGARRELRVRLIYPADATPPQVLSLLPLMPAGSSGEAQGLVKQSPTPPAIAP